MYLITYQLKWSQEEISFKTYDREEVLSMVKQLNKWITSLNGKLVDGIISLSDFSVIEHNYDDIDEHNQHFMDIKVRGNGAEFHEIPEFCLKVDPDFIPSEKDITDKLFLEVGVLWGNDWKVSYDKWILTTFWEVFLLKSSTKYSEAFDLIYSTHQELQKKEIIYEDLREVFNTKEYSNLVLRDILYTPLRDILKDKLIDIKNKYELEIDIISLHTDKIIINYI